MKNHSKSLWCTHSGFDFIEAVYELFNNPLYIKMIAKSDCSVLRCNLNSFPFTLYKHLNSSVICFFSIKSIRMIYQVELFKLPRTNKNSKIFKLNATSNFFKWFTIKNNPRAIENESLIRISPNYSEYLCIVVALCNLCKLGKTPSVFARRFCWYLTWKEHVFF